MNSGSIRRVQDLVAPSELEADALWVETLSFDIQNR